MTKTSESWDMAAEWKGGGKGRASKEWSPLKENMNFGRRNFWGLEIRVICFIKAVEQVPIPRWI